MNEKLTAEFDIPCAGLGLGVFTGCIAACFAEPAAKYVGIAVAVFLLILSLARRKRQFLAAGLLFGLVSMTAWQLCCAAPLESLAGSDIRTECRIVSVNYSSDVWTYGRALCIIDGRPALIEISGTSGFDIGDSLDADLSLEKPEDNIFTFSDGVVISGKITQLHSRTPHFSLMYHLGKLRTSMAERFSVIGGDEAELCRGLILGIRSGFSMGLERDILYSGVSYMTAVSGAHITIFVTILCELLGKKRRRNAAWLSIAAAVVLEFMFGFSASVMRAGTMLVLTRCAALLLREISVTGSLCVSLLILTVFTPFAAADPALQMSALGVFGASVLGPRLNRVIVLPSLLRMSPKPIQRALNCVKKAVFLSLSAWACVIPVSSSVFGGFSLVEVPASVALSPFFAAGLPLGLIYAISGIPGLALPLGWVMKCFRGILAFFGSVDGAWLPFDCDSGTLLTLLAMAAPALLFTAAFINIRPRHAFGAFALDVLLIACIGSSELHLRQRIDFVSDGSSGAAVVYSSNSAAVIISGKTSCTRQLARLLTREGVTRIGLVNAPQMELSGMVQLMELTEVIPAENLMLPESCSRAIQALGPSVSTVPAAKVTDVSGITIACIKAGSSSNADITLYYSYTGSPADCGGLALYASSRQNELPDGAINIHDEKIRINIAER